jgi:hypothetical protein
MGCKRKHCFKIKKAERSFGFCRVAVFIPKTEIEPAAFLICNRDAITIAYFEINASILTLLFHFLFPARVQLLKIFGQIIQNKRFPIFGSCCKSFMSTQMTSHLLE